MAKRDLKSLKTRESLILAALKLIEDSKDDPRYSDSKAYYELQLAEVRMLINQIPPDIVIGMNTANTVSRVVK